MNRKKVLLSLGILYGVCGIGAGVACYGQAEASLGVNNDVPEQNEEMDETAEAEEPVLLYEKEEIAEQETVNEEMTLAPFVKETIEESETISEIETKYSEVETESEIEEQYEVTVIGLGNSSLRIRDAASLDGKTIGYMKNGETAELIELGEAWHLICYKGIVGYSSANYLEIRQLQSNVVSEEIGVNESE